MKLFLGLVVFSAIGLGLCRAQTAPVIVSQPSSQSKVEGEPLALSVSVNGTSPFTYKWTKDGVVVPSATTNVFSIPALAVADTGSYQVTVTNAAGSKVSAPILIDVTEATPPSLYSMQQQVSVVAGDFLQLNAYASGSSPLTYEWRKGDLVVSTTSSSSYSKANAQSSDSGTYTVTVTNAGGTVTSGPIVVAVSPLAAPVFSYSPSDREVAKGSTLSMDVSLTRSTGVTLQWYKDGQPIPGATSYHYYKSPMTSADVGTYTVKATNSAGTTTSGPAVVTLAPDTPPSSVYISHGSSPLTAGQTLNMTAYASGGTAPLSFEWMKDGGVVPGAVGESLSKANVAAGDAGTYTVRVFNELGSVTSSPVQVAVRYPLEPVISSQPASITVYPGDGASFSVTMTPSGGASFQWRKDGVAVAGANSNTYTINSAAASDEGVYTVVVTTAYGTLTSDAATLQVLPPYAPQILTAPVPRTANPGDWVSFSVEASGRPQPTYQWFRDGEPIAGATNPSYSVNSVASSDAGDYTVTVTNSEGSVTSEVAPLSILETEPASFQQHPASVSLLPGAHHQLGVTFDWGYYTAGVTYQWYHDDVAIGGATSPYYSISSAQPANAGRYKIVATNAAGSVTSRDSVVTVDLSSARPLIIATTGSLTIPGGHYVNFGIVLAPGHENAQITWKKDGVVVPNATTATFSFQMFDVSMAGTYVAEVESGSATAVSQPIVLEVKERGEIPRIRRQPAAQTRKAGDYTSFTVEAGGEAPLTYQWLKDGQVIPAATQSTYQLSPITSAHEGDYSVTISNRNGSVTSEIAAFTVLGGSSVSLPVISRQPAGLTVTPEAYSVNLAVELHGNNPGVGFQWFKDGLAVPGATSSYFWQSIYPDATSVAGNYKVVITSPAGSVTSDEVTVAVATQAFSPTFTVQPASQVSYEGGSVTFTANATHAGSYQWRRNGTPIDGAVGSSLTVSGIDKDEAASYSVLAINEAGVTPSNVALLTVSDPTLPQFTEQPTRQNAIFGGTATFTATASGLPPPTYQWQHNGKPIDGATSDTLVLSGLESADAGSYSVVATNSAGSTTSAAAKLQLYETMPVAPFFITPPQNASAELGKKVTFTASVGGTGPFTYQWYRNGTLIPGAEQSTLTISPITTQTPGTYSVVAMNEVGQAESDSAVFTLEPVLIDVYQGFFVAGTWSLLVYPDNTGTLVGAISPPAGVVFYERFPIAQDGSFSVGGDTDAAPAGGSRALSSPTATDARFFRGRVSGTIASGVLTAQVEGVDQAWSGYLSSESVPENSVVYRAVSTGDAGFEIYLVSAGSGRSSFVLTPDVAYASSSYAYSGDGSVQLSSNSFYFIGQIAHASGALSGNLTIGNEPAITLSPLPYTGSGTERLAAVSTRSIAGVGSETLISGFAISGTQKKQVLIRAVGPTLESMGVSEFLANPRLAVFKGQQVILQNDDWSSDAEAGAKAAEAAARLGDFALPEGSTDAALVAELDPGVYTTHVSSTDGTSGIVLLEVYDASPAGLGASKVLALSTRGAVRAGDGVLIVGFVVEGPAPKRVMVRGVGPGMGGALSDALKDPQLRVYNGSTAIAENDDWSSRADAADLADAAAVTGAGALALGSKDAAVLLYLAPGIYTAHVSGANNTTGIALVEVYEVP